MSAAFYQDMAQIANDIIGEFQQGLLALEWNTPVGGVPWDPGDTPLVQSVYVKGVVQPIDRKLVDGMTVLATDRLAILPALDLPPGIVPSVSDKLYIDGEPTIIQKVLRVPEAGVIIVYKLVLRS